MTTIEARVSPQAKRATPLTLAKPGKPKANRKSLTAQHAAVESEASENLHAARVTKHDNILTLLSRREGATIPEMMKATRSQQHSVRGFLAGTVKKKLGFTLTSKKIDGELRRYRIESKRGLPEARQPGAIELTIDAKLRRVGKGIRFVVGGRRGREARRWYDCLLRDAHATREALMSGRDETIDAMAQRLGINRDTLSAQMRRTYLAPDIVRALVLGRPADGLTPAGLLSSCKDLPHDWLLQRTVLGLEMWTGVQF